MGGWGTGRERGELGVGGDTPVWVLEDEEESLELCRRQGGKLQTRSEGPFFANGQAAPRGQPQRSVASFPEGYTGAMLPAESGVPIIWQFFLPGAPSGHTKIPLDTPFINRCPAERKRCQRNTRQEVLIL